MYSFGRTECLNDELHGTSLSAIYIHRNPHWTPSGQCRVETTVGTLEAHGHHDGAASFGPCMARRKTTTSGRRKDPYRNQYDEELELHATSTKAASAEAAALVLYLSTQVDTCIALWSRHASEDAATIFQQQPSSLKIPLKAWMPRVLLALAAYNTDGGKLTENDIVAAPRLFADEWESRLAAMERMRVDCSPCWSPRVCVRVLPHRSKPAVAGAPEGV